MGEGTTQLSISIVPENLRDHVLVSRNGSDKSGGWWKPLFTRIPDGVYRVVVEAKHVEPGVSGVVVDDIQIASCDDFGRFRENRFILNKLLNGSSSPSKKICFLFPLFFRINRTNGWFNFRG